MTQIGDEFYLRVSEVFDATTIKSKANMEEFIGKFVAFKEFKANPRSFRPDTIMQIQDEPSMFRVLYDITSHSIKLMEGNVCCFQIRLYKSAHNIEYKIENGCRLQFDYDVNYHFPRERHEMRQMILSFNTKKEEFTFSTYMGGFTQSWKHFGSCFLLVEFPFCGLK